MKFVCPHCRSKYAISDGLIQGKKFKIRCKVCDNIISVKGPPAAPERSSTASSDPAAPDKSSVRLGIDDKFAASFRGSMAPPRASVAAEAPSPPQQWNQVELAVWYAGVEDKPVGPKTARQIDALRREGRINDHSLVWRKGMADWAPLSTVTDLGILLDIVDRERASLMPRAASVAPPAPESDARPSIPSGSSETAPAADYDEDQFFDEPAALAAPPSPGSTPDTPAPIPPGSVAVSAGGMAAAPLAPPRTSRLPLLVAGAFFVTALGVLGAVVMTGQTEPPPPEIRTVEKVVEKIVYRDRYIESPATACDNGSTPEAASPELNAAGNKGASQASKKRRASRNDPSADEETLALMAQLGVATPRSGGPVGGGVTAAGDKRPEKSGSTLSADQMKGVINRNKGSLKSCYERSLKKGEASSEHDLKVEFKVTIGAGGTVRRLSLGGGADRHPTLSKCLERSVKRWVFPASSGESKLAFPFVFTPTR